MFHVANLFIKPENREKTGFVMFSGGIERDRWHWNGLNKSYIFWKDIFPGIFVVFEDVHKKHEYSQKSTKEN